MLYDRPYMLERPRVWRWPAATVLTVLLATLFVVQACISHYGGRQAQRWIDEWLALSVSGVLHGRVWQFLSFQFLHSTPWPWHVLGNCLGLFFIGNALEEYMGTKRFLRLYLGCGLLGGLVQFLATLLLRNLDVPVIGASAGVMGLLAAFGWMFPEKQLTIFLYFVPVNIRAKLLFWIFLVLSAYGTLVPYGGIAHGAHFGGLLGGMALVLWGDRIRLPQPSWRFSRMRQPPVAMASVATPKKVAWNTARKEEIPDPAGTDFISKEVDPILDKISAHGIQSLTERERRILEAARSRMGRR